MTAVEKARLMPYSLLQTLPELVLKNANIVDVFTKKVRCADIAIQDGRIVGVGEYQGVQEIDLSGKYVAPGFIDAHVHIESSMVSPRLFSKRALYRGTTTIIADPHEITNVVGLEGLQYMLQDSENALINIYFTLPSCVPLNQYDNNGAIFSAEQMKLVSNHPRVVGLGEVMNYEAILQGDEDLLGKIELMEPNVIDGHAPGVTGKALQAYRLAGAMTDHECSTFEQALERIQAGFVVQVREGSAAKNLTNIISGVLRSGMGFDRLVFCTDDMHLKDIETSGHIDACIRKAIALGADPVQAITAGTLNAARLYGLREVGAIAPGFRADLVILDDLSAVSINMVYKDGIPYTEIETSVPKSEACDRVTHSVHIPKLRADCFARKAFRNFPVIEMIPGEIITRKICLDLPEKNGRFAPNETIQKVAVIQRHDGSGRMAVGALAGFGLKRGAVATTIAHDAHNLIVAGCSDADMLCAVQELQRCQGGYTVVCEGKVLKTVTLSMAGLFTDDETLNVTKELEEIAQLCHDMGVPEGIDPFVNLSFLALPVIPELRITDVGIFDVMQNKFLTENG